MVNSNELFCPICNGSLKYYDRVKRIVRTKGRKSNWIDIRRLRCEKCGQLHRELPDYVSPYKQYESEVIIGVIEGFITPDTYGYEDYPCEMTMKRWRSRNLQSI